MSGILNLLQDDLWKVRPNILIKEFWGKFMAIKRDAFFFFIRYPFWYSIRIPVVKNVNWSGLREFVRSFMACRVRSEKRGRLKRWQREIVRDTNDRAKTAWVIWPHENRERDITACKPRERQFSAKNRERQITARKPRERQMNARQSRERQLNAWKIKIAYESRSLANRD